MIIVPKWRYIFLSLLSTAGIVVSGILGYIHIPPENKGGRETVLFISLLLSLVILVFAVYTLVKSKNVIREMERLVRLSSMGGFSAGTSLKKLGKLGNQIIRLYYQLNITNRKRFLKIGGQKNLLDFIIDNFHSPLFVSDVTGSILYTSSLLVEKFSVHKTDLIGEDVASIFPDVNIKNILKDIEVTHTFKEYTIGKELAGVYPVKNGENEISYLVFVYGKQLLHSYNSGEDKTKKGKILNLFRKITSNKVHQGDL